VTGLTNGTAYSVKVRAVNGVGDGTASDAASVTPATIPAAPASLTVTPGNGSALVSFTPGSNGGDAIIRYEASTNGGTTWAALSTTPGTGSTLTATIVGLTNGTPYAVKVRAVNGVGDGTASGSQSVTPAPTAPGPPTDLTVTAGNASISLSFRPPADDGGASVTGYEISLHNGGQWATLPTQSGSGNARTATVTGLQNATTYPVRVRAVNTIGGGDASGSVSTTPIADLPDAPTGLAVSSGNASIAVTLVPPVDDGGSAVTGYDVSIDDGVTWSPLSTQDGTGGTRSGTVGGLTNGTTYRVRTRAANSTGAGAPTDAVPVVAGVPGAPSAVTATAGTSSISVSWTVPDRNAELITTYTVTANPGPATCTTATAAETTCVLGAVAGPAYTVTVVAHTAAGVDSARSEPSDAVTPAAPNVPVNVPDTDADLTTDQGPINAAAPGQAIVLIGTGFAAYSTVTVAIYSAPTVLALVTADAHGDFTHTVTVPADLPVGTHTFLATGVDPDGEPFAMKLAVTVAPAAESGPPTLPITGPAIIDPVETGLALIGIGVIVLVGGTRRRRTCHRSGPATRTAGLARRR
jgi:titin